MNRKGPPRNRGAFCISSDARRMKAGANTLYADPDLIRRLDSLRHDLRPRIKSGVARRRFRVANFAVWPRQTPSALETAAQN